MLPTATFVEMAEVGTQTNLIIDKVNFQYLIIMDETSVKLPEKFLYMQRSRIKKADRGEEDDLSL